MKKIDLSSEVSRDKEFHGKIIARLTIIMMAGTLLYSIINVVYDAQTPWFIFAGMAATGAITYILNKRKKQLEAKIFGLTLFNIIIYLVASSESHLTNIYLYFTTAGAAALVLFEYNEKRISYLFVSLSVVLFLLARYSSFSLLPERTFSDDLLITISIINLSAFVYVTCYLVILVIRSNYLKKQSLRQQNLELIKTNEELDRFVYSASHDLRAPLSSLLGLIQLVEMEKDVSRQSEYLKMMRGRISSLDIFIREILDYAKNVRQEIKVESIVMKNLLHSVIEELKYMEGADKVLIQCNCSDDLVINSDLARLRIIFSNLISNAIKYKDASKPLSELSITITNSAANVKMEFKDNGIGILPVHQEKVFEMFYRAHEVSTGSGMGLYLVKQIVENLNGSIQINSEAGAGSSFMLNIPK